MTNNERQQLKADLIKGQFWSASDLGDPTIDKYAASKLHNRTAGKLAAEVYLTSISLGGHPLARQVNVVRGQLSYRIASGDSYAEAISLAAIALPDFLKQHPECAAD